MKSKLIFICVFLMVCLYGHGQYFRSGIFLHHSTGACIWGPNGSNTSVPQEMVEYNLQHGFSGSQAVSMNEEWWIAGDNEWATQHAFFEDPQPSTGIGYYLPDNPVIVIKTCFPASSMVGAGQPSDTLDAYLKTIYNYKWHWRHIIKIMELNPENFFVIWTNAPLEPASTNTTEAALSKWFCTWAKDTLATGLDPVYGAFPPNIYVFDFFHKLTGPNGMMLAMYAAGPGDSHPNAAATALVAPQFVQEIFDSSIGYELIYDVENQPASNSLQLNVFPNPCRESATISFTSENNLKVDISLYDHSGKLIRTILRGTVGKGNHSFTVSVKFLQRGVYHLKIRHVSGQETIALVVGRE